MIGAEVISDEEITELRRLLGEARSHRLVVLASATARTAERARALLKRIEWSASTDGGEWVCPECDHEKAVGHKPDCELAALIGVAL